MFKLRALHGDVRLLDACSLELGLRLGDIGFRRSASIETIDRELQRVGIGFHRIVEQLLLRIRTAQLEVVQGQIGMKAEIHRLKVPGGGLRFLARRRHCPTHPTPEVHFIREIKWQHKITGVVSGLEVRSVPRVTNCRDAGRGRNCGKFRGPIEVDQGPSLVEPRLGHLQILIGNRNLFFQRIELRITEDFPPLSTIDLVAGLGGLPTVDFFKCVSGNRGHGWFSVSRSNRAPYK